MAIDISSIIQNHLTNNGSIVEESTGINFEAAVDAMSSDTGYDAGVGDNDVMFMSESEVQSVRGAIIAGIIASAV